MDRISPAIAIALSPPLPLSPSPERGHMCRYLPKQMAIHESRSVETMPRFEQFPHKWPTVVSPLPAPGARDPQTITTEQPLTPFSENMAENSRALQYFQSTIHRQIRRHADGNKKIDEQKRENVLKNHVVHLRQ